MQLEALLFLPSGLNGARERFCGHPLLVRTYLHLQPYLLSLTRRKKKEHGEMEDSRRKKPEVLLMAAILLSAPPPPWKTAAIPALKIDLLLFLLPPIFEQ